MATALLDLLPAFWRRVNEHADLAWRACCWREAPSRIRAERVGQFPQAWMIVGIYPVEKLAECRRVLSLWPPDHPTGPGYPTPHPTQ
jgi:hypothetical protein